MYQGKRCKKQPKKRFMKPSLLMIALISLMVCLIGSTLAYIVATDGPITNIFTPSHVSCQVNEATNGTTKSNVTIQNTGNTDAYIRAMVVVTWKNADGEVYGASQPTTSDYTMSYNLTDTGWTKHTDGFYYYDTPVAANANTDALISSCTSTGNPPAGYHLSVEIIADAVQANAVTDAWGYTPSGT